MERFLGNEAMYLRFWDMESAFAAAHTLKGVTANMGLTFLYQAVCMIVELLRAREQCENYPALHQKIQAEVQRADLLRRQLKGGRE